MLLNLKINYHYINWDSKELYKLFQEVYIKSNYYREVIVFPQVRFLLIQKNSKLHRLQQKTAQSRLGSEIYSGIPGILAFTVLRNNMSMCSSYKAIRLAPQIQGAIGLDTSPR